MTFERKENQLRELHWQQATEIDVGCLARFSDARPELCSASDWHYGILTTIIHYNSHDQSSMRYECQHGAHRSNGTIEYEEFVYCQVQRDER
jgi:hypothetical protein